MCKKRRRYDREGLAVVELAVCLPVLVLLVMGAIELSSFIFLKQGLSAAAYEGVRTAVQRDADNSDVDATVSLILNARGFTGSTTSLSPSNVTTAGRGENVTVTVSAPSNANRIVFPRFVKGVTVAGSATMVKE